MKRRFAGGHLICREAATVEVLLATGQEGEVAVAGAFDRAFDQVPAGDVDDPAQLPDMCERLLSNPLIEEYEIESSEAGGAATISDRGAGRPAEDSP